MQHNTKHQPVKIAGGSMRGRKLLPPPGKGTRPMTGMAKKSLFSIILPWLDDALVLDLYSGTGTLGLESISRGASQAYFAEKDRLVISRLKRNCEECNCQESTQIWAGNIESNLARWVLSLPRKIDVAFLDPPYPQVRKWNWTTIERKLFEPLAGQLAEDGLVILRTPGKINPPEKLAGLIKQRVKTYGDMQIFFYSLPSEQTPQPTETQQEISEDSDKQ